MRTMPVEPVPASRSVHPPSPGGLVLAPFRALRYDGTRTDLVSLTSPPYDVLDAPGVEALERSSDINVVRLILPRDEHEKGDRHQRAARTLASWRASGLLTLDPEPALYVYEQASTTHVQRGLLGALALAAPEDGIVLPHESTMAGTVSDRFALYTAVEADLEPIFLVYTGGGAASRAVADASAHEPVLDVVLPDGLRHRLWALTDPGLHAQVAADLYGRTATIADGHHRYETYLQRQSAAHAAGKGAGPWDRGLTLLVDTTAFGPEVRAIHRVLPGRDAAELAGRSVPGAVVHDLDGQAWDAALSALAQAGTTGPAFLLASGDGGTLRLLTEPAADRLDAALPHDRSQAWRGLDVTVLHRYLVEILWGAVDDVDSVRYAHDVDEALALATATDGTAVLLNPTPIAAVAAVAAAGERMPRKSTLFLPKPRTGLVLRTLDDD